MSDSAEHIAQLHALHDQLLRDANAIYLHPRLHATSEEEDERLDSARECVLAGCREIVRAAEIHKRNADKGV